MERRQARTAARKKRISFFASWFPCKLQHKLHGNQPQRRSVHGQALGRQSPSNQFTAHKTHDTTEYSRCICVSRPIFCYLGNRTNERKSAFAPVWGASMLQQGDIFAEGAKRARSQMSKEEMHDTILMSSLASAHPPRVFARAIKAMILQTELLRGAARAAMQQEIRGVLDTAQTERDTKCARLTSSADAANCLEPAVGAASSSLCFETAPSAGNVSARDQSNDAGEPETSAEPFEPADFVRVSFSGIFAPSCNSCGWLAGQCACVILQE